MDCLDNSVPKHGSKISGTDERYFCNCNCFDRTFQKGPAFQKIAMLIAIDCAVKAMLDILVLTWQRMRRILSGETAALSLSMLSV